MYTKPLDLPAGCNPHCPGCSHRLMTHSESLRQKEDFLKKVLYPWKDLIQPVIGPGEENHLHYRNKVILHASYQEKKWLFGMLNRKQFIPIMQCPVHGYGINNTLSFLSSALPPPEEFPLAFYVQAEKQVTLILKTQKAAYSEWLDKEAEKVFIENRIEGIWIHYNPSAGRRLFEKTPMKLVWGSPWSVDDRNMQYGPRSFQQLIPSLYHFSLQKASAWLNPGPDTAIVDLYSGTGNSLKYWIEKGSATLGIELSGEAVTCAQKNIPAAIILRGKCSERIPQADAWAAGHKNAGREILLYANPPRTGIEPEVLQWVTASLQPSRIAYLSCSPGTLSKNLATLCQSNYSITCIQPFDFFPLTKHVECLVLLSKTT